MNHQSSCGIHFQKFPESVKMTSSILWGVEEDFAIKIDNLHVFDEFIDVDDYEDSRVLQSFYHVENNELLGKLLF